MSNSNLLDSLSKLKAGLLAKATDGDYSNKDFLADIMVLIEDKRIEKMIPSFIATCRNTDDFRRVMQAKFKSYKERRDYINNELEPIFQYLISTQDGTDAFSHNVVSYELGERIGNGGFGTVHKYHHKLLNFDFAIKLFEPVFVSNDENLEGEKRFFREAKVLFELNHKNIVRVFDIGRIEGQPFIRMELIDGDNLQEVIEKHGIVSFERSLKPICAILEGLAYAHSKNVVHRDLKPTNIMVTKDKKFKIIDFGISAYLESENHSKLTKTGESVVSGAFSDPLLIYTPSMKDVRSDIYSIGAIWYYLIVGRSPAGGDIRQSLLQNRNITLLQAEIILKCLSGNIEKRFNTCEDILLLLQSPKGTKKEVGSTSIGNNEKKITEITRDEIMQLLIDTYNSDMEIFMYHDLPQDQAYEKVFTYYGRKSIIDFLKRVYDFETIPSQEKSFEEELFRHLIRNSDYDDWFVFQDERLKWFEGDDEIILKFVCEMFHPIVRNEKCKWKYVFDKINELLKIDGYELYEIDTISNRSVYSYRYYI